MGITYNNMVFDLNEDGTYCVSKYLGSDNCVCIPNEINGIGVTTIGYYFYWNNKINHIKFGSNIKRLEYCYNMCLESVEFDENTTLEEINDRAFYYCINLKTIKIPRSIKRIGVDAFLDCKSLENVIFEKGCELETIDHGAFADCENLKTITIPKSVGELGNRIFSYCTNLNEVIFEDGIHLKSIGMYAFRNSGIKNIQIPYGIDKIRRETFYYSKLEKIIMPNSIKEIGISAFNSCEFLTDVVFSNNLTNIEETAFMACYKLEKINFPKSLRTIAVDSFLCCIMLRTFTTEDVVSNNVADYILRYALEINNDGLILDKYLNVITKKQYDKLISIARKDKLISCLAILISNYHKRFGENKKIHLS